MAARRILVTGAGGMAGSYAAEVFLGDVVIAAGTGAGLVHLDVCDSEEVASVVSDVEPDVVLHLAAATDVDRCEQDPDWAYRTNAIGTQHVALACQRSGAVLVYVSTGAIFSGEKAEPYIEFDTPQPVNVYGRSKLAAEQIVTSLLQRYYIVRTGWMVGGGVKDKKFVGKIARLLMEGQTPLRVVNDTWGSPTYAHDLLEGIRALLKTGYYGVYHLVNKGRCTRYEIALVVRDLLDRRDITIVPVSSADFILPAPRGRSEALRNFRLELLGLDTMRAWPDALRDYVERELTPVMSEA